MGVVALSAPGVHAQTTHDLLVEADRLVRADDARSLERAVDLYEQATRREPASAAIHVKLAAAALDAGDGSATDALRWYDLGKRAAERAVALDPGSADAHFLLAATRGQIAKRRLVSPAIVGELEEHLRRALAANPRHPRALHMMGRLLSDTPLALRPFLNGRRRDAERYLRAAVDADPNFPEARLDLAEHYRREGRVADARAHAQAVIDTTRPTRTWRETYRPAAEALLRRLAAE